MIIGTHAYNALLWVKHHEKSPSPERNPIGRRTESDRTPNATRSGGGRNPIGRRTESDRAANGIRSDGERNLIGRRTESDRTANGIRSDGERYFKGVHLSPLDFAACQSKKCTNKAILK